MVADPYEQTGRRTKADPEQRVNPPEQDPAEVRRNNILGYLEEALGSLTQLMETLDKLYDEDSIKYISMMNTDSLPNIYEELEEWQYGSNEKDN